MCAPYSNRYEGFQNSGREVRFNPELINGGIMRELLQRRNAVILRILPSYAGKAYLRCLISKGMQGKRKSIEE